MTRASLAAAAALAAALWACAPARAADAEEPDPCAATTGRVDLGACWAREAQRAEAEMNAAYGAALARFAARGAEDLRKSQRAWLALREAHLGLLYELANPAHVHHLDDLICASIARRELTRERTRVLRRLLEPADSDACRL